jgi:hypothetical protein
MEDPKANRPSGNESEEVERRTPVIPAGLNLRVLGEDLVATIAPLIGQQMAPEIAVRAIKQVYQFPPATAKEFSTKALCGAIKFLYSSSYALDLREASPLELIIRQLTPRHSIALLALAHGWTLDAISAALDVPSLTVRKLGAEALKITRREILRQGMPSAGQNRVEVLPSLPPKG